MGLWKTTIIIWSPFDPQEVDTTDLVRDADTGESYQSFTGHEFIHDPWSDPHAPSQEFFQEQASEHEPHGLLCMTCGIDLNDQCLDPDCTQDDDHTAEDNMCTECARKEK